MAYERVDGTATIDSMLAMGIYVADSRAVAVGITALELPLTNISSDWLWWTCVPIAVNTVGVSQDSPISEIIRAHRGEIDGKAMRKIEPNQILVFVTEMVEFGTPSNVRVLMSVRLLFKK